MRLMMHRSKVDAGASRPPPKVLPPISLASRPDISPPPAKRRRLSQPAASLAPSLPSRLISPLGPNQLRIFAWNVNGIAPFLQPAITTFFSPSKKKVRTPPLSPIISSVTSAPAPLPSRSLASCSLRDCLQRWQYPQIVCLQEVKIARKDTKTQNAVSVAVRAPSLRSKATGEGGKGEGEPGYIARFGLPRDRHNAKGFGGKVYGVCTLIRKDFMDRECEDGDAQEVDWDLEGRVLKLEVRKRKLVIFNVYAVNGTENAWRDSKTGEVLGTRFDRKRAFHTELASACAGYEAKGWNVMIAGDINIARSPLDGYPGRRMGEQHIRSRQDFEEKFMTGGLAMRDSYREVRGNERKYSYRSRGVEWGSSCDRVDLILASRGLHGLVEADILDEEAERGPSDHCPLYVTLDLEVGEEREGVTTRKPEPSINQSFPD